MGLLIHAGIKINVRNRVPCVINLAKEQMTAVTYWGGGGGGGGGVGHEKYIVQISLAICAMLTELLVLEHVA